MTPPQRVPYYAAVWMHLEGQWIELAGINFPPWPFDEEPEDVLWLMLRGIQASKIAPWFAWVDARGWHYLSPEGTEYDAAGKVERTAEGA